MKKIIQTLIKFRDERDWAQYHTLPELARALSVEAGELNELFLWSCTPGKLSANPAMERVGEEVADVLIYALNICAVAGLDPYEIVKNKIAKNEQKYPVDSNV